jgi:oligopeptide/dipeptide ABC transporter ATP-binding protein
MPLLTIRDLVVVADTPVGERTLVRLSALDVEAGEMLALVGETGSGKTLTGLAIPRVFPSAAVRIAGGEILFDGRDLTKLDEAELARLRGREIGVVFQDPMSALNPVFPVGRPLVDLLRLHLGLGPAEARREAARLLRRVELPDAERLLDRYPHELSGGQRQRVTIAMAIAARPRLLIADEPTTALDVTVQAELLRLLDELRREAGMAVLFITHNLGVVAHMADRVAILYAGDVVEEGPVRAVLREPRHPYTRLLLAALPRRGGGRLEAIAGTAVPRAEVAAGCAFAPRCPFADERCREEEPSLVGNDGRRVACWRWEAIRRG